MRCVDGRELSVRPECLTPLLPPPRVPAILECEDDEVQNVRSYMLGGEDVRAAMGDDIDCDAAQAQLTGMLRSMGVTPPSGRPLAHPKARP